MALTTAAASPASTLDPRFAAILAQNDVPTEHSDKLATAGYKNSALFGHVAKSEERVELFLKRTLNLDPETRGEDTLPVAN